MKATRVTIVGLGLIGGSLGLALKRSSAAFQVTGVDSHTVLEQALALGVIDVAAPELAAGVREADVIIMCTPVLQIPGLVKAMAPHLKPGTIVTDVGSTKQYLREQIIGALPAAVFYVGGHPMAGREKSGVTAAESDLFRNKWYIITPQEDTPPAVLNKVCELVRLTGARVTVMDTDRHDRCAAIISHVPHVAAAALVNLVGSYPCQEDNLYLAGGGFCDTTRIASSNADMWSDICLTNEQAVIDGLEKLQALVGDVITAIRREDREALHAFFSSAKERRDDIIGLL